MLARRIPCGGVCRRSSTATRKKNSKQIVMNQSAHHMTKSELKRNSLNRSQNLRRQVKQTDQQNQLLHPTTGGQVQRKETTPQQKHTENLPSASMDTGEEHTSIKKEFDIQSEEQAMVSSLANQNTPSERPDRERKTEASDQQIPGNRAYQSQAEDQSTPLPPNESLSDVPSTSDDAIIAAEGAARFFKIPKSKISLDNSATETIGSEPENAVNEKPADNLDRLEEPINLHPSPLQSVWPVQEKATSLEFREAQQPSSPTKADEAAERYDTFTIPKADVQHRTGLRQDFGQIQNRLEQVHTTPSDSSIEYIPPRHPRPVVPGSAARRTCEPCATPNGRQEFRYTAHPTSSGE